MLLGILEEISFNAKLNFGEKMIFNVWWKTRDASRFDILQWKPSRNHIMISEVEIHMNLQVVQSNKGYMQHSITEVSIRISNEI